MHGLENPTWILADLWTQSVHTDSKMASPFLPTANKVCGLYPFSPEQETCCKLSFCRTIAFLTYNAETGLPSCNLPFSSTASLWTSIDKPIKLLLSWKKGGPSKMGDSWFLYVNRKEWRVYDMSFFLVTRLLNARTCLFRTDSKQSLRPFVFIWKGNGTVPRLKSDCLPV